MQMTRSSILIAITLTLLVSNAAGNPFLHTNLAAHLLQEYPIVNTVSSREGGCGNASFSSAIDIFYASKLNMISCVQPTRKLVLLLEVRQVIN